MEVSKCPGKRKKTSKIPKARRRKNGEARSDKCLLFFPLVSRDTNDAVTTLTCGLSSVMPTEFTRPVILVFKPRMGATTWL